MQLEHKNAVIYGAAGAIGSAVALAFAKEGAKVFLTARTIEALQPVADLILAAGGAVEVAAVDASDEQAIDTHFQAVVERAGQVDISLNATGMDQTELHGTPLLKLSAEQLLLPITTYVRSNFLTARAAGRHMSDRKKGVIILLTAPPAKLAAPLYGGLPATWSALESLTRTFAGELGSSNVRVVALRSGGMPETATIHEIFGAHAKGMGITAGQYQGAMEGMSLLKRLPSLHELTSTITFVASDNGGAITGTTLNLSVGAIAD